MEHMVVQLAAIVDMHPPRLVAMDMVDMIDMVWGPGIVVWIFFRPTMSKHHPTLLYRNTDSRGAKLYFLGEHVFVCTSIPSMVAAESPMRDLDFKERNDGKCHFWDLIRVTPPERY